MGLLETNVAPINEAVALLAERSPAELETIRKEFPALAELARPGMMLGETTGLVVEKAQLSLRALQTISRDCGLALDASRNRLRRSWNFRLGGDICALVGSTSVLGFAGAGHEGGSLASGVVAFLGALASLLASRQEKLVGKDAGSIEELYNRLHLAAWRAGQLTAEIEALIRVGSDSGHPDGEQARVRLGEAVAEANALCADVNRYLPPLLLPRSK